MPDACVAADVIIGFPGESDEDFMHTHNFIDELPVSYLHVFTYSDRPEAKANLFTHKVPAKTKKERSQQLHILGEKKARLFHKEHFDKNLKVLWEGTKSKGFLHGFTENYIQVKTEYNSSIINKIVEVNLDNVDENGDFLITFEGH